MQETEDYAEPAALEDHATTHQDSGDDEISVAALSGLLADEQNSAWVKVSGKPVTFPPNSTLPHKASHQDGGTDEINLTALSGQLADDQPPKAHALGGAKHTAATLAELNAKISDATLDHSGDPRDPNHHLATHEIGGADPINLAGLPGKHIYLDRGDPAAYDMNVGDFTTDANWHDIDLSGLTPYPYALIHIYVSVTDDLLHSFIRFREKGNSNVPNSSVIATQVANIANHADIMVSCDPDGVFEYKAKNTTFTAISLVVKGWWMP